MAAIIAQDAQGLSLNYSSCELLPPNCTRIMFFIILSRYQDIFSAIWGVFRGLSVTFLSLWRRNLQTILPLLLLGCSGWSWGWCWVWGVPPCWHCCVTGGGLLSPRLAEAKSEQPWGALLALGSLSQVSVYFYKSDFFLSLITYLILSFFLFWIVVFYFFP